MRVLIDTNVLLDAVARREPFSQNADKIIELCRQEKILGMIAAHTVVNAFYILRKNFSVAELKELFLSLCEFIYVEPVDIAKIIQALQDDNFSDFEDSLQEKCAANFSANYIITRDLKDYRQSAVPAITPEDFLEIFNQQ